MAIFIIIEVSYLDILMKQKSEITINKFERTIYFTNNYWGSKYRGESLKQGSGRSPQTLLSVLFLKHQNHG